MSATLLSTESAKQASRTSSRVTMASRLSMMCSSPTAPIAARATPTPKTVRKFPAAARNFGIKKVAMLVWAASAPLSGPVVVWSLTSQPRLVKDDHEERSQTRLPRCSDRTHQ